MEKVQKPVILLFSELNICYCVLGNDWLCYITDGILYNKSRVLKAGGQWGNSVVTRVCYSLANCGT
jgi:hypothetical protein